MFFQNTRNTIRLHRNLITFLLGIFPAAMVAATSELDTFKACQTVQAMFTITPQSGSPVSVAPGQTVEIAYNIVNNARPLPQGFTSLATSLMPNAPQLTVNITNPCTTALAKGASCMQTVQITAANDITPGAKYNLSALVCGAGLAGSFCSNTCQPLVIEIKSAAAITTMLTAAPNPLQLITSGSPQNITVTNTGQIAAKNINTSARMPNIGIGVNSLCPASLAPGGTCQIEVTPGATAGSTSFNIQGDNVEPAVTQTVNVVPPAMASLSVNLSELALSGLGGGIARQVTITNVSPTVTATNLTVSTSALPGGTSFTTFNPATAGPCLAAPLAPGGTCVVTFTPGPDATPGPNPSIGCNDGSVPTPTILTVNGDNVFLAAQSNIYVLKYGCIYQGGYVFSIDDTTPNTQSVGGVVVQTSDEIMSTDWNDPSAFLPADDADIPGIDDTSTSPGACNGNRDGLCNTNIIVGYYAGIYPSPSAFAAKACADLHWAMPAICQLSYGSAAGCGTNAHPIIDNIQSNLVDNGNIGNFSSIVSTDLYWSSTQYSASPEHNAWTQHFQILAPIQTFNLKSATSPKPRLRCIRSF